MHLDQPEVLNDCTYFVVGYQGNRSSLEKLNSLRDHFEITKQVRSISLTSYNDNIMCTIFGDVVEHILQYWMNVFDNSSSELLFDFFNNDNEKLHFRDVISFLAMKSINENALFLHFISIFKDKQKKLLEIGFNTNQMQEMSGPMFYRFSDAIQEMRFIPLFKREHIYALFDLICPNCQEIYCLISTCNASKSTDISSNLMLLHSILTDELFITLMIQKSGDSNPFK